MYQRAPLRVRPSSLRRILSFSQKFHHQTASCPAVGCIPGGTRGCMNSPAEQRHLAHLTCVADLQSLERAPPRILLGGGSGGLILGLGHLLGAQRAQEIAQALPRWSRPLSLSLRLNEEVGVATTCHLNGQCRSALWPL